MTTKLGRILNVFKAILKVLLKTLIIGGVFLSGLAMVTDSYAIAMGYDMVSPNQISTIGMILMLVSVVIWKLWGIKSRVKVEERWRIEERERAHEETWK